MVRPRAILISLTPVVVALLTVSSASATAQDRPSSIAEEAKELQLVKKWREIHLGHQRFLSPEAFREGQVLQRRGWGHSAIDRFETARRLNPEWALPHLYLALALLAEEREFARAETALVAAAELAPQNPRIHEALSRVREHRGDPGGAADALLAAIRLRPQSFPDVDFRLAELFAQAGRGEAARVRYELLITRRPDDIVLLSKLEALCEQLGDWDAAEGYLKTLLRQTNDPRLTHYKLGQFYERKGDLPAAKRAFHKAEKLQRKDEPKKRKLRPLRKSRR